MIKPFLATTAALIALAATPAAADPVRAKVQADLPDLMAIYRDLHQNPELSFQEVRSARIMARSSEPICQAIR